MNLTVLKVNVDKIKIMVMERAREQTNDFTKPYRIGERRKGG